MSESMQTQHQELKRFLAEHVYKHYRVRRMTRKAHRIISGLYEAFMEDPNMLPPDAGPKTIGTRATPDTARAIADYISGMTDRFAIAEYERIFNPSELT